MLKLLGDSALYPGMNYENCFLLATPIGLLLPLPCHAPRARTSARALKDICTAKQMGIG